MGRTWLVRGGVVAVLAVLVGAWAVGLAGLGGSPSPAAERNSPASPDSSTVPDNQRSAVREKAKPRRTREAARSQDTVTAPSPDTAGEPADDAPGTPAPTSPNTPDAPDPSEEPSDSPPPSPSNPPSQPADDCTDLAGVMDCALDPITGQP